MNREPATDGPTVAERGCEVEVARGDRDDHLVVAVRGVLSTPPGDAAFREVLRTQLLDRGRVVVDLSGATTTWASAVQLFPDTLASVGGWPQARLALARPEPFTRKVLKAARVHLAVPLAGTVAEAGRLLDVRPPLVARRYDLPCDTTAPVLARMVVESACRDWELDDYSYDLAATVATELVTNAVTHSGTTCVLHIALDRRCLQVAVHDGRPVREGDPEIAAGSNGGYGLLVVQELSRGWGVTPDAHGKTVWALLDVGLGRST